MLPRLEDGIVAVRRRRWLNGWVERVGAHAQVALFALGVTALLARVGFGWERAPAAGLLALAALALVTALARARRAVPP